MILDQDTGLGGWYRNHDHLSCHYYLSLSADLGDETNFHFTSLHFTSLHFTSLHFTSLHFTSLHFTSLHFTSLHFTSLHFTSLHFTSLHFTSLHFTSLHFTSLHFTSLHFTSPHLTSPHLTLFYFIFNDVFYSTSRFRIGVIFSDSRWRRRYKRTCHRFPKGTRYQLDSNHISSKSRGRNGVSRGNTKGLCCRLLVFPRNYSDKCCVVREL